MLLHGRSRDINSRRRKPEWINIRICPTTHVLISDNSPVRKHYSILTLYRMRMQGYCDIYKWTILKRTSPEVTCLHPTSSRREMCTSSVSNVSYHKLVQGAAFYTPNGENVNVILEYCFRPPLQKNTNFSTKYFILCKFYTNKGGIK